MKGRTITALIIFLILTGITSWLMIQQLIVSKKKLDQERFKYRVESLLYSLQQTYKTTEILIEGIQGLFKSSEYVTQSEWTAYAESLDLEDRFPEFQWISFVAYVLEREKAAFILRQKGQNPRFTIWPEAGADILYPVTYIYPPSFQDFMGYDFHSDSIQAAQFSKSMEMRRIETTFPISLDPVKEKKSERLIFLPIVQNSKEMGWAVVSIDFAILIGKVLNGIPISDMSIEVYAGDETTPNSLIFERGKESDIYLSENRTIDFAGTKWTFVFHAESGFETQTVNYPIFLFLLILLAIFFFIAFLYLKYLDKVALSNASGFLEKSILKNTEYAVIATDLGGMITYVNPAAEKLLGYKASEMIGKMSPTAFHDPEEMERRAAELTTILDRKIYPGIEVFVIFARKDIPENRQWTYIRKDQSRVSVRLSTSVIRDNANQVIGYFGVVIESSKLRV